MQRQELSGAYVNARAQLMLLVADADDSIVVLSNEDTVGHVAVSANATLVTLKDVQGVYNGVDVIKWENGDTWRRIDMSVRQFRFLTQRPRIPLTMVALVIMKEFSVRAISAVVAMGGVWMTRSG